jgi:hypothetical protein
VIRLPLRDRPDVFICYVPIPKIDGMVQRLLGDLKRQNKPARLVSLQERAAYQEAMQLAMEQAAYKGAYSVWIVDTDKALIGIRPPSGGPAVSHAIRVIEILSN